MEYDYNTTRKKMVLPEYGRNVQMMVDHIMTIQDRDLRNKAAHTIIEIMGNLNPQLRDISDFNHKLWDHLAIMSDFKLDIDSPYETPKPDILNEKPRKVEYNNNNIRFKHYGRNIEMFIEYAIGMDEGEAKNAFIEMIANHMKKLYLTHNRENVTDAQIFSDLNDLSKGQLIIPGDIRIVEAKEILSKKNKKKPQQMGGKKNIRNKKRTDLS